MEINQNDMYLFMSLLRSNIYDLKMKHNELAETIARCQLPKKDILYKKSDLSIEYMKDIQLDLKEQQHELYIKWYELNEQLKKNKLTYSVKSFEGVIIGEAKAFNVIERWKNSKVA